MSISKHDQPSADEELPVDVSNDIERTPTDKSGDETQRNEQGAAEDGIEHPQRRRRKNDDVSHGDVPAAP